MAHDGDADPIAPAVPVIRVAGHVRTRAAMATPRSEPTRAALVMVHVPTIAIVLGVAGLVAGIVLTVVLGNLGWGMLGGVALIAGAELRRLSQRVSFSFGEGFLPYRSDLGWPRGVQEDDDVHWAWAEARRN